MTSLSFTVISLMLFMTSHHAAGQTAQCASAFQTLLSNCATAASVNEANFLWFVTDGTSIRGTAPADQAAFKTQVCAAQQQIGTCVFGQAGPLFNDQICQGQQQVVSELDRLFQNYDAKCAHPCRKTLLTDMRACYTNNGLNADLFLGNRTKGHVIGETQNEIANFCSKKDTLMNCLKSLVQNCPESPLILQSQSFDLLSYETGINILCAAQNVYLTGLPCFDQSTPAVDQCSQKYSQTFMDLTVQAQQQNWTQERFLAESCSITINQTDCTLNAWAQKPHVACTTTVIGLRREVECNLMPPNCATGQKAIYDVVCNPEKFYKTSRV